MKLRKKISTTVQILSHIKEKLNFVNDQREQAAKTLAEKEQEVKQVDIKLILLIYIYIYCNSNIFLVKVHFILSIFGYIFNLETLQLVKINKNLFLLCQDFYSSLTLLIYK